MARPATKPSDPFSADLALGTAREAMQVVRELLEASEPSADDGAATPKSGEADRTLQVLEVGVDRLHVGSFQPRRRFSEESLNELAISVGKSGVLQPIIVRKDEQQDGGFEIVAGERRWRAAKLAKLPSVPIIVRELSDASALEMALVENVQREDLTPIELAEAYRRLMDEFDYTQESLGTRLGKSRSQISNTLRLLNLPSSVKDLVQAGQLSAGHARAILNARDPEDFAQRVVSQSLSVRKAEQLARRPSKGGGKAVPVATDQRPEPIEEPTLTALFGRKVTVSSGNGRYDVTIHCEAAQELYQVIAKLKSSWNGKPATPGPGPKPAAGPPEPLKTAPKQGQAEAGDPRAAGPMRRNVQAYGPAPKRMTKMELSAMAAKLDGHRS